MRSASFRRIARLFASLLLLWTAADVCDYGLCSHHRAAIGADEQTTLRSVEAGDEAGTRLTDDCFCCSRLVDVRTPFRITLAYQFAWSVTESSPGEPHLTPAAPYHPPLAGC